MDLAGKMPRVSELVPKLSRYLPDKSAFMDRIGGGMRTPRLPRLSGPSAPSLPSGGQAGEGGSVALWLLMLGVVGYAAWKGWARYRSQTAEALAPGGQLGPWPVAPAAVSTRAELIQAFEYLALLCLGPAARPLHHLDLAAQLGGQKCMEPDRRREVADHLARLYEQARYAPADEALPEAELRAARRDLCYLAGVTAP
jgi:hypothetical protein